MEGLQFELMYLLNHELVQSTFKLAKDVIRERANVEIIDKTLKSLFVESPIAEEKKLAVRKQLRAFLYNVMDLIYPNYKDRQIDSISLWLFRNQKKLCRLISTYAIWTIGNTETNLESMEHPLITIRFVIEFYKQTLFKKIESNFRLECSYIEKHLPSYARFLCNKKRKIDDDGK